MRHLLINVCFQIKFINFLECFPGPQNIPNGSRMFSVFHDIPEYPGMTPVPSMFFRVLMCHELLGSLHIPLGYEMSQFPSKILRIPLNLKSHERICSFDVYKVTVGGTRLFSCNVFAVFFISHVVVQEGGYCHVLCKLIKFNLQAKL